MRVCVCACVQAEKAKSRAAEQACSKAQSEAKRSAVHLAQVIQADTRMHVSGPGPCQG